MPKTAAFIEESKAQKEIGPNATEPVCKRRLRGGVDPMVGKATQFKPGNCANPGGRPKHDLAAQLAREVIEGNYEQAACGLAKQLAKGNAYTFKELAERGYGKLKETKEVTHFFEEVKDADLNQRIADLERDLGLAAAIDDASRAGIAKAGAVKTNGAAKDNDLLPR